jgi:hypothetical protein
VLTLATAVLLAAAPTVKLAAPGFGAVDVPDKLAEYYSDTFATQLALNELSVMTRGDLAQVLGLERQKQLVGCGEAGSCTAELVAALGVDGLVVGTLAKIGRSYQLNVKVISAANANALAVWSTRAPDEETLMADVRSGAAEVARDVRISLRREVMTESTARKGPSVVAPLVTGGLGLVASAGGVVLLVLSAQHLAVLNAGTGLPDGVNVYAWAAEGKTDRWVGALLTGVGGAAVIGGVLWALLGTGGPSPLVWVTPHGASVGFAGVFP